MLMSLEELSLMDFPSSPHEHAISIIRIPKREAVDSILHDATI